MSKEVGITVSKNDNFSEWYTQVIIKAELADYAPVKGLIVLRPDGYSIWESIKESLDSKLKETGHRNGFLPVLIPESLLAKEKEHFEGLNPEVFWVTHSGNSELGDRLALRPTSETLAYSLFSKWIRSWRDLPLKMNFWNTALRAEIKGTKPFLRTSEFLWQEGHTVHATKDEAEKEVADILELYKKTIEEELAVPVITGKKSENDKFVGAVYTDTLESLMPDGKALQMGTSHFLGQNFSKPFDVKYLDETNTETFAWQTSWGVSWRLIGGMIMTHGDDKGLILPPKIAPIQVVIIPIYTNDDKDSVIQKANQIKKNRPKTVQKQVQKNLNQELIAPDFTLADLDGNWVSLSELKGKVVLIQFTASWCGVCRKEMPHLEKDVWLKYKDHPDFFMVGVDLDEPLEKVISFGESVGITYPLALDPGGKLFYQFAAQNSGVTRNILSDRDGNIIMLTRLFDQEEFNRMTAEIEKQLE